MSRKRISDRTKLAALTMLHFGIPYAHAKLMTDYQINSLVEWHHNVHHSAKGKQTVVPDVDHFSNLEPFLIAAHVKQTKIDRKVMAKIDRMRKKFAAAASRPLPGDGNELIRKMGDAISAGWAQGCKTAYERIVREERKRKIRSRGFDKTRRRTMRGKVVPR